MATAIVKPQDSTTIAPAGTERKQDHDWYMDLLEQERYGDSGIDERGTLGNY